MNNVPEQEKDLEHKPNKIFAHLIIIGLLMLLVGFILFFATSRFLGEDSWMCRNGGWVKHGVPSAPKPKTGCGVIEQEDCSSYAYDKCPKECVVCPPCPECSSISCRGEEFCLKMGFDREWAELVAKAIPYSKVRLDTPHSGEKISSPLVVKGVAKPSWFFEETFPVILTNWDGLIISEGKAVAGEKLPYDDFVRFKVELEFEKPDYSERGSLILKKENPSGLPENDDAFEVSVIFE